MIRFEGQASVAREKEELQHEEHLLISNIRKCAREERETCAQGGDENSA
jgi:hypothetical protein